MYCYVFICILGINPAPHLPNGTLTRFPPSPLNQCTLLSGNLKRQPPHLQLPSQQGSWSVVWMQQKSCSLCARSLANAAFRCLSQLLMRYIKFIIPSLSMLILPYYLTLFKGSRTNCGVINGLFGLADSSLPRSNPSTG